MKKRGFGAGRWNGFGGKVQPDESIEDAAKREILEEAGIEVNKLDKRGILEFEFQGNPEILEVHVFRANEFLGEPTESEKMKPQWFYVDEIPFGEMWADDKYWIPLFLEDKKFKGKILFGESDSVLENSITEAENL